MKRLLVLLLLSTLAFSQGKKSQDPKTQDQKSQERQELFGEIDAILADLGKITGWKAKRKVPAAYITRDKLRQFLEGRMKQEVKLDDVHVEEQILEMFGLVPAGFDLKKSTVDLVTEQAAAFYDYNARKLFVLESDESTLERRVTLAHELAHALADQQFSLRKFIRNGMQGDDMSTARQAVVEGQATWLMWAYMGVRNGKQPSVPVELLANAGFTAESAGAGFPVLAESPRYLRESLIFPYTRGLLFQNELYKSRGQKSFTEAFLRPPDSTQQILHPERWLSATPVQTVKSPPIRDPGKYKLRADGTIGEFDHKILLRQYIDEEAADRISPLWRAGAYKLYHERNAGKKPLLAYATTWDTPETATSYLALYKSIVTKKSKNCQLTIDTPARVEGLNEYGRFEIWTDGSKVFAIEGRQENLRQ
jgi:hypothetical protein